MAAEFFHLLTIAFIHAIVRDVISDNILVNKVICRVPGEIGSRVARWPTTKPEGRGRIAYSSDLGGRSRKLGGFRVPCRVDGSSMGGNRQAQRL